MTPGFHAITGPFGYTGAHITRALLAAGTPVLGLTSRPAPTGLSSVTVAPYHWDDPERLAESLKGAAVLYNTYWVRFDRGSTTFDLALSRIRTLLQAARTAGVGRIVHLSVTNASVDSPFPYFRGKGLAERMVRECGVPYSIVRPALVFGEGDILLNNIAWFLRRSPVFGVPDGGRYRVQPIAADDLAAGALAQGRASGKQEVDAIGPETLTFWELVRLIRDAVGGSPLLLPIPGAAALAATWLAGKLTGDVVLTPDELAGLRMNLLTSNAAPLGERRFAQWLTTAGPTLGRRYQSEIERHYPR